MMTEDVNAAVRGALAGGATQVTVNDAHGPMRNPLPDLLHPAAELIRGRPKPMGMLEGLGGDFDATVCVGYHARAGALGVLSHSFMGREIEDIWLDDRPAGEIGLVHATAAALGAPVIALSGDDAACAEMAGWDPAVATVAVKQARDRFAAQVQPVARARESIERVVSGAVGRGIAGYHSAGRDAATRGTAARCTADPGTGGPGAGSQGKGGEPGREPDPPVTLAIRWQSASVPSVLAGIPGVTLRDSRTAQVSGRMPDLFRLLSVFISVAAALTGQSPYC
jgi:D-amino peptidase